MTDDPKAWLIWSTYHGAWHRPEAAGYTVDIAEAGLFTKVTAQRYNDNIEKRDKMIDPRDQLNGVKSAILACEDRLAKLRHKLEMST